MTRAFSLSRRDILTALPAAGISATLPAIASASEPDPVVVAYHEWLDARREWLKLAELPDNGNFDDPRSLALDDIISEAEELMFRLPPTSLEGIAAIAAVAWFYVSPGNVDPDGWAEEKHTWDCRAVMAIWKACTGRDGYPVT